MRPIKLAEDTTNRADLDELAVFLGYHPEASPLSPLPRLTQGEKVAEFEAALADYLGVEHAVYVNSGSSANLLAYSVLTPGRVVLPAVSWATTVAPALQLRGWEPVLCDAEPRTWGLDPERLATICRRQRVSAVVVVHVLGVPTRVDDLLALRDRWGFRLLEDACGALGSTAQGDHCGTLGDAGTYSFYYGHQLSTVEGGALVTDDRELARRARMVRAHGWGFDLLPWERPTATASDDPLHDKFTFHLPGFNLRATEIQAVLGLSALARHGRLREDRARLRDLYASELAGSAVEVQEVRQGDRASPIAVGVLARSNAHRRRIVAALAAAGVETRPVGGGNMARQPFLRNRLPAPELPVADAVHDRGFQLPCHPSMTEEEVREVCDVVKGA